MRSFITASVVALSLAGLANAAASQSDPNSVTPECAANCMTVKLTEAAGWYGQGNLTTYCTKPNFLDAYNHCLQDHCKGDDLEQGKKSGEAACASATGGVMNATAGAGDAAVAASAASTANGAHSGHASAVTGSNSPAELPLGSTNSSLSAAAGGNATATSLAGASTSGSLTGSGLNASSQSNNSSRFSNAVSAAGQAAANSTAPALGRSSILIGLSSALVIAAL